MRFRMPPPESLVSSGDSCAARRTGFRVSLPWGGFGRQSAAVWGYRLVAECGLVHECGVFAVPVRMVWLLVFAKICCGTTCRLVTAISVVPKLGQLKRFGCPVFDVALVRSGRRAV